MADAEFQILEKIRRGEHLVEETILVKELDWMNSDPEIIEAICGKPFG